MNGRLGVYWTLGDLGLEMSHEIFRALIAAQVDLLEIGLPFSDPLLDGPLIQASHHAAVRQKYPISDLFAALQQVTQAAHLSGTQVSLMTPSQLIYTKDRRDGLPALDGILVTDIASLKPSPFSLPSPRVWFISQEVALSEDNLRPPEEPVSMIYLTRVQGLTGEAQKAGRALQEAVQKIRAALSGHEIKIWVGFGISTAQDVQECYASGADGAIIGSAFVRQVHKWVAEDPQNVALRVMKWVHEIRGNA